MKELVNGTINRDAMEQEFEKTKNNYGEENSALLRFGGLWKSVSNKNSYYSSFLGESFIYLKKNEEKTEERWQDFDLMMRNPTNVESDICLSRLALKASKKGGYLSGLFGNVKLLIFKNEYYEKPTHPYYLMYLAPKPEKVEKTVDNFELS